MIFPNTDGNVSLIHRGMAITVAGQSEFISRELPVALMNKYFEYQTQLCHDAEGAPDTESWERAHSFLII